MCARDGVSDEDAGTEQHATRQSSVCSPPSVAVLEAGKHRPGARQQGKGPVDPGGDAQHDADDRPKDKWDRASEEDLCRARTFVKESWRVHGSVQASMELVAAGDVLARAVAKALA